MKNFMRRTVAFMLMACLLLSVMAPVAMAITDNGDGSYTYTFAYDIASGNERPTLNSEKFTGDFVAVARNQNSLKTSATTAQFQTSATAGAWYAFKFTVQTAGYYNITTVLTTQATSAVGVDLHILESTALAYEADNADNETVIDAATPAKSAELIKSTSSNPTIERVHFATAGDYLFVLELATAPSSVVNFSGFTMTDVTEEVEAELEAEQKLQAEIAAFPPSLVEGSYVYTWAADADDRLSNSYPSSSTNYYGNFAGYANSVLTMYKPYNGYMQIQSARTTGYIALRINVPAKGIYNVSFDVSGVAKVIDVFFVDPANMTTGYEIAANGTYVDGLTGGQRITVGSGVETLSKVSLDAGDYLMVWRLDSTSATGNTNFYSMTMTDVTAELEAEQQLLASITPSLENGVYTYSTVFSLSEGQFNASNHYTSGYNLVMDKFIYTASSTYGLQYYAPSSVSLQFNNFGASKWYAFKMVVPATGKYDITVHESAHRDTNVYLVPAADELVSASGNTANQTYVDSLTPLVTTSGTAAATVDTNVIGVELTAGTYYMILEGANETTGLYRMTGLTLTPYSLCDGEYATVNDAIAGGETSIELTTDLTQDVVVSGGATLDLAGKIIYGDVAIVDGQIIDSVGTGGIVGDVDATGNDAMAIYDGDICRFYTYTVKSGYLSAAESDSGYAEYWFDVDFANTAAYALLADSENAHKVSVKATLAWSGETSGSKEVVFDTIVTNWAAEDHSTSDWGLCLQITNIPDGITTVTVTPEFVGSGATAAFDAMSNA